MYSFQELITKKKNNTKSTIHQVYFINFIHTIKFEFIIIVIIAKTEYLPVLSDDRYIFTTII